MSDELSRHRERIDAIDAEILGLLSERASHAQAIGRLKNGANLYRPEREAQVLRRAREANSGPLSGDTVARLFREIMSACLALEQPQRVAYLGPAGTYSQAAALKQFGQAVQTAPMASIDDVFRCVEAGQADYAVVPVENSTEGAVGRSLDLLVRTPLTICGEVMLPIHHCLMAAGDPGDRAPDVSAGAIHRIYSHAQSLGQCHEWLNQNLPGVERLAVASNAEAARLASLEPGAVAIAGEQAAGEFGLQVLARNIEDEPGNTTRFLVLGHLKAGVSGHDKTSLILSAPNRPGAMHALLTPLADYGVSMSRLESRPAKGQLWEYLFFIDVEGHAEEAPLKDALAALASCASFIKVLGSYPAAAL